MKTFVLLASAALAFAAPQQLPSSTSPPGPGYSTQANDRYKPEVNEACLILGTNHKRRGPWPWSGHKSNFCFLVDQGKKCSMEKLPAPFAGDVTSIQMPKHQVCTFYTEEGCKGESVNWDKSGKALNLDDYNHGKLNDRIASLLCKKSYDHSIRDVPLSDTFSNATDSSTAAAEAPSTMPAAELGSIVAGKDAENMKPKRKTTTTAKFTSFSTKICGHANAISTIPGGGLVFRSEYMPCKEITTVDMNGVGPYVPTTLTVTIPPTPTQMSVFTVPWITVLPGTGVPSTAVKKNRDMQELGSLQEPEPVPEPEITPAPEDTSKSTLEESKSED
ncbi:hypothetical protein CERZMDRAFT_85472 [Cercospora zeae-maydis SCOH1-5]|uniref:Uncharacterized protein n=1 Tax=Cercospora zeae-maydis SCOH1-5 TaxID=717836 RepID=A0A6A6FCX5_9PEZI|nr:hypothetical protein CERZMDRAFT_85472 [Cercospora zeae-maydis SCOH1-5]